MPANFHCFPKDLTTPSWQAIPVATTKNQIAAIFKDLGDYQEAYEFFDEALAIQMQCIGSAHATTLVTRSNLASCLGHLKRYDEAAEQLEQVVEAREEQFGMEHALTLKAMVNHLQARVNARQLSTEEQVAEWRKLQNCQKNVLGADHHDTLVSRNNLANALLSSGRVRQALTQHKAIMDLRSRKAKNAPDTLISIFNVACCACLDGDMDYSLKQLSVLAQLGWEDTASLKSDPDLGMLRDTMMDEVESIYKKCDANRRRKQKVKIVLNDPANNNNTNVHV